MKILFLFSFITFCQNYKENEIEKGMKEKLKEVKLKENDLIIPAYLNYYLK